MDGSGLGSLDSLIPRGGVEGVIEMARPLHALSVIAWLAGAVWLAGVFSGCESGGSSGSGAVGSAGAIDPTQPRIVSLDRAEGRPGDEILVTAFNLPVAPDANALTFMDAEGDMGIRGQVVSVVATGVSSATFGEQFELTVVVPVNARTGTLQCTSTTDSDVVFAGALDFVVVPQLVTIAVGNVGNLGRVIVDDIVFTPRPRHVEFVGYNMETVDACSVRTVEGDFLIEALGVEPFSPGEDNQASWALPTGMSVVSVTIPSPFPDELGLPEDGCAEGDTYPYEFNLSATLPSGATIDLPPVEIQVKGLAADIVPAAITGVVLPSGVRSGVIPITYSLFERPATSRWDMCLEFLDPSTGEWVVCAGVGPDEGHDVIPGGFQSGPLLDSLVGPGAVTTFFWDTMDPQGGLPDGRTVTRLRLTPANPEQGTDGVPCAAASWETGNVVVANDAPDVASVVESFLSDAQLGNHIKYF